MRTLSALINEYRKNPSDHTAREIADFLLRVENPEALDRLCTPDVSEWRQFGDIRVKLLGDRVYAVTESYPIKGGYMCFAYKINLYAYSKKEIAAYESNCPELNESVSDEDIFAVLSIASAYDTDNAELCEIVKSEEERDQWYETVDREVR